MSRTHDWIDLGGGTATCAVQDCQAYAMSTAMPGTHEGVGGVHVGCGCPNRHHRQSRWSICLGTTSGSSRRVIRASRVSRVGCVSRWGGR
jgi:hypothetical protein